MPKANWEETCSKCIFGSAETRIKSSAGSCTHKHPKSYFNDDEGWMCDSFVRRWDTREDLELSKKENHY